MILYRQMLLARSNSDISSYIKVEDTYLASSILPTGQCLTAFLSFVQYNKYIGFEANLHLIIRMIIYKQLSVQSVTVVLLVHTSK